VQDDKGQGGLVAEYEMRLVGAITKAGDVDGLLEGQRSMGSGGNVGRFVAAGVKC